MKSVIVVSICEKVKKMNGGNLLYEFHFRGFLSGYRITKVFVESERIKDIIVNEEYVLYLEIIKIEQTYLYTRLLKSKALKNICYVYR